jgi:hypothetical protein
MTDNDPLFFWSLLSMALFGLVTFALGMMAGAAIALRNWAESDDQIAAIRKRAKEEARP